MPWRVSRRWSTCPPHSAIHRFRVLNSCSCLSQTLLNTRRESSSASASALLRLSEPLPAAHGSRLDHNVQRKLPVPENKSERKEYAGKRMNACKNPVPLTPPPDGLLQWLDKHFASAGSAKIACQHIDSRQDWSRFLNQAESVRLVGEQLAQTDVPQRALHLLKAAHSIGVAFKPNVYECVVYHLAMAKEWGLVLAVVSAGLRATGKTTSRLLNWRGRALLAQRNFAKLDQLLEEFAKHGMKPQCRTYMLVLQGHLRNHNLVRARATIKAMEDAGFPVTASTYTTIVPAYRGFGFDNFIESQGYDALSNHQVLQGREKILNGLLRLHLDKHDLDGALQLLEQFSSLSNSPESGTPNIPGAPDTPARPVLEDHATYTILIDYLSRYGPSSLNVILRRMRRCGGEPDIKVAAALIRMHYVLGEEHHALAILRDCCRGHSLEEEALRSLGYDSQSPPPSAFAPFSGHPTTELFNCVLHGAIGIRGLSTAIPVLRLMKDAQVKPDVRTLETFLWHLARERPTLTEDLVNVMRSLLSPQIRPTLGALNILLKSMVHNAKRARHREGWNALATYTRNAIKSLKQSGSGWTPHYIKLRPEPTFDPELCITDLQSSVLHGVLEPIVQSLRRRRVLADRATFSLRMQYDTFTLHPSRAPEAVAQNLQTMRDRGLHPNVYHYAALMEAYCAAGNIRAAHEVLQDTISQGLVAQQKSHAVLYTILISANARIGRPDLALSIFREMLNANVTPDVASVDALVGAFFAVKAFRLARRVLLDLWPMVAPFPMELRDASLSDLIMRLREIRDRAEIPNPDVKRRTALDRNELMRLINDIIAEWKDVSRAKRRETGGARICEMESARMEDHMSNARHAVIGERMHK